MQQSVQKVVDDQIRNFANVSGSDEKMQDLSERKISHFQRKVQSTCHAISSKTSQSHQRQKDEIN
ncbi:MAG: hypothetical protein ACJ72R_16580 [Nitrososphaeraceae archaeon]